MRHEAPAHPGFRSSAGSAARAAVADQARPWVRPLVTQNKGPTGIV
jgi:hypothetical protein